MSASSSCSRASSSPTHGPDDIALGFSTSGGSQNVLRAFAEARARGLLTVGMCGYDGGAMAASGDVEHCLVVRSDSVHRVQETQQALLHALWSAVQRALDADRRVVTIEPDARAREAAVLDRIEAFRRRKPRLLEEVVTLAHGAGGKASAALLDAVFLPAFAGDDPTTGAIAQTDAALLALPSGETHRVHHRLLRREAAAVPGRRRSATSPSTARSTTSR